MLVGWELRLLYCKSTKYGLSEEEEGGVGQGGEKRKQLFSLDTTIPSPLFQVSRLANNNIDEVRGGGRKEEERWSQFEER